MPNRPGHSRVLAIVGAAVAVGVIATTALFWLGRRSAGLRDDQGVSADGESPGESAPAIPGFIGDNDGGGELVVISGNLDNLDALPGRVSRLRIPVTDETGRLVRLFELDAEALPSGWYNATNIEAWIYSPENADSDAGHAIHIVASEGSILAPNNNPQSGDLRGEVRLSLFEAPDIYSIDDESAEPTFTVETTSVSFNSTLGQFMSEDEVIISGRRMELRGRGLSGTIDEAAGRPTHLSIAEYDWILVRAPEEDRAAFDTNATPGAPARSARATGPRESLGSGERKAAANDERLAASARPTNWYELVLDDGVRITHGLGDEDVIITTDRFAASFALTDDGLAALTETASIDDVPSIPYREKVGPGSSTSARPASISIAAAAVIGATFAQPGEAEAATSSRIGDTSLPQVADGDTLIQGDGRLELHALDQRPATLADPADLYVELTGREVVIDSQRGDARGGELVYSRSAGQVTLSPHASEQVHVSLDGIGAVSSEAPLWFSMQDHRAGFDGAGVFHAAATVATGNSDEARNELERSIATTAIPPGLMLEWNSSLVLAFAGDASSPGPGGAVMSALQEAFFRGAVRVDDAAGHAMTAEELDLAFGADDLTGDPLLTRLLARENATIITADGHVQSNEITADFVRDADGATVPSIVTMNGDVVATDGESVMTCGELVAELEETPSLMSEADDIDTTQPFQLASLVARREVRLSLPDGYIAYGDELIHDAANDLIMLHGSPVSVQSAAMRFTSPERIEIHRADGSFIVPTGGELLAALSPGAAGNNAIAWPADREALMRSIEERLNLGGALITPPDMRVRSADGRRTNEIDQWLDASGAELLRVHWSESMNWTRRDDGLSDIEMLGSVRAESAPAMNEYNLATGDRLFLSILEQSDERTSPPITPQPGADPLADAETNSGLSALASQEIVRIEISGDAENRATVNAAQYADSTRDEAEFLLTLRSGAIAYEAVDDRLRTTAGELLIVDYREDSGGASSTSDDNVGLNAVRATADPAVQFSGAGETLFEWAGRLTLSGESGEAVMSDQVNMIHRPLGATNDERVKLMCRELLASFTPAEVAAGGGGDRTTPGVGALSLSSRDTGMDVRAVVADGEVIVESGSRYITADRLTYDRATMEAILLANGANFVSVTADERVGPFEAKRIVWDLARDRLRAEAVSPVQAPDG